MVDTRGEANSGKGKGKGKARDIVVEKRSPAKAPVPGSSKVTVKLPSTLKGKKTGMKRKAKDDPAPPEEEEDTAASAVKRRRAARAAPKSKLMVSPKKGT